MKVIFANSNNMDLVNNLLNKNNVVVFFTAPWCGHCQRLKPVMENVFGRFKHNSFPGALLNVSENEIPRMTVNNRINGYPTIRHYHNGQVIKDYDGIRDEKSIAEYLAKIFDENMVISDKMESKSLKNKQKKRTIRKRNKRRRKSKSKKLRKRKSKGVIKKAVNSKRKKSKNKSKSKR